MLAALVVIVVATIVTIVAACAAFALRDAPSEDTAAPPASRKKPIHDVRLFRFFR